MSGLGSYFDFYNCERPHQALAYQTPQAAYLGLGGAERTFYTCRADKKEEDNGTLQGGGSTSMDAGETTMPAGKQTERNQEVPGEHHPIYSTLKMRCFYCGLDARAIVDNETAFWAYRQFDVDHVVPRKMFNSRFLKEGLGTVVGKKHAPQATLVIEEFNQVPACHSCNILLNAYPDEEHAHKVDAFIEFFSPKTNNKPEGIMSDLNMNTPGQSAPEVNDPVAALAPIKEAILNVWEDKRGVLIERLKEELRYYSKWYVEPTGMPALDSLRRSESRELVGVLKDVLEQRWLEIVLRHLAEKS